MRSKWSPDVFCITRIWIQQKNGKHVNVCVWFHTCDCICALWMRQNGLFHYWRESRILRPCIIKLWIQPPNLTVRTGFPKKNRSEGERGVWNTWILQCCIRYGNAAYAFWVYRILALRLISIGNEWLLKMKILTKDKDLLFMMDLTSDNWEILFDQGEPNDGQDYQSIRFS